MENATCLTGNLQTYRPSAAMPWNEQRVKHLYKRLGFGIGSDQIQQALDANPQFLVNQLIEQAIAAPLFDAPEWLSLNFDDYNGNEDQINSNISAWIHKWLVDMIEHNVRGKLILFWHNHFVAQLETYYFPSYLYHYHRILQATALGNFRDFVYEIGKSTAMLLFLNGAENTKYEPNENYARELYELFTLGRDNGYTQEDIEETARALTGWNNMPSWGETIQYSEDTFDNEQKTIFGLKGNWGYNEVHEILFTRRKEEISNFICEKIYKAYVNPIPNREIISQLAETFVENDWEIAPVLEQLFKSEHFFSEANIGVIIKSPYDLFLNYFNEVGYQITEEEEIGAIHYFTGMLGQELALPVDVAGWQGNRTWIDTSRLTGRWRILSWKVYDTMEKFPNRLSELAFEITGENTNDPALVTQKVIDYFLPASLHTPELYERATTIFKVDIPQNYFDNEEWNLNWDSVPWQMTSLIQYIIRIPEYQLM